MQTVLIAIHLLIVIALVGVILIQRSEGGGLGVGGGAGFMTARGSKNALTRLTALLAVGFFITSITLGVMGTISNPVSDILNRIPAGQKEVAPSLIEQLGDSKTPDEGVNTVPPSNPIPGAVNPIPNSDSGSVSAPVDVGVDKAPQNPVPLAPSPTSTVQ
ncbi:preprotein translocase subunit SecG [Bartonella sp. DGB2]|uniref:preprotein translocase subunit SecG n=1 Tax=Bartonella sp. DGB2 TaxID=3388426 RepID=UPI00398FD45A